LQAIRPQRHYLVLVNSLGGGGAERVAALLCNAWAAGGHGVTLVPTFGERTPSAYPIDDSVSLVYPPARGTGRSPLTRARRVADLRRIVARTMPDVVVAFQVNVNIAALLATFGTGVPVIVCDRSHPELLPLPRGYLTLRRWMYPKADRVVVQTESARRWFSERIPAARADVLPNPVLWPMPCATPELPPEEFLNGSEKLLLATGRLDADKRFDLLIRAFTRIGLPGWKLVVVGEGSDRDRLARQIASLGAADGVLLPGWAGNIGDWYARADVYAFCSRYEGFPNALLEAMAAGLAVISVDCVAGPAELIDHDRNGLLVPLDDEGAFQAQLEVLMRSDERRQALGAEAKRVREDFSLLRVIERWDVLIADVVGGGPSVEP